MALEIQQTELGRMLGRGPWEGNVDGFVEELVALMPSLFKELPVAKVEAIATDSNPEPIKIDDFTTSGEVPLIQVTRGTETFNITLNPQTGQLSSSAPNQPPQRPAPSGLFIGLIMSYAGANVYSINIYPTGQAGQAEPIQALQLNGDAAFPHRADGTLWAFVCKTTDGSYYLVMPTWE